MLCRRMGLLWRYLVVRVAKEVSIADGIKLNGLVSCFGVHIQMCSCLGYHCVAH